MVTKYYNIGRSDNIKKLFANPERAGTKTPKDFNDYMNGYNSINNPTYKDTVEKLIEIVESSRAKQTKEGLAHLLSNLLIKSLNEPADVMTETDTNFKKYLDMPKQYDASELESGFLQLYNAVQKSKRFTEKRGEITKILRKKESKKTSK